MVLLWSPIAVASIIIPLAAGDYVISPGSVPLRTRQRWCFDQQQTCPLICEQIPPGSTLVNSCDPIVLTYGCLCGNNLQPNISEYTLTMPFYVCQEWQIQCQAGCAYQDNPCTAACTQNHPCGAQNRARLNATTSTSSVALLASATGRTLLSPSGPVIYTGPGTQTTQGTTSAAVARFLGSFKFASIACGLALFLINNA